MTMFNKLSNEKQETIMRKFAGELLRNGDKKGCDEILDLLNPSWRKVKLVKSR